MCAPYLPFSFFLISLLLNVYSHACSTLSPLSLSPHVPVKLYPCRGCECKSPLFPFPATPLVPVNNTIIVFHNSCIFPLQFPSAPALPPVSVNNFEIVRPSLCIFPYNSPCPCLLFPATPNSFPEKRGSLQYPQSEQHHGVRRKRQNSVFVDRTRSFSLEVHPPRRVKSALNLTTLVLQESEEEGATTATTTFT